jgi:hypothetical protein
MPSCSITGGGGTGATCEAVGRAIIEWAPIPVGTYLRTFGGKISELRFREPAQAGTMAIHYQSSNYPINQSGCTLGWGDVCERLENYEFSHLDFLGSNQYTPASLMISGDCNTCTLSHLSNNPSATGGNYQTMLIATNWSIQVDDITNEGDGIQYGSIDTLACGGNKNGSAPCFVGRLQRSAFRNAFCDGVNNASNTQAMRAMVDTSF